MIFRPYNISFGDSRVRRDGVFPLLRELFSILLEMIFLFMVVELLSILLLFSSVLFSDIGCGRISSGLYGNVSQSLKFLSTSKLIVSPLIHHIMLLNNSDVVMLVFQ
eukprot:555136_1